MPPKLTKIAVLNDLIFFGEVYKYLGMVLGYFPDQTSPLEAMCKQLVCLILNKLCLLILLHKILAFFILSQLYD